MTAWLLDTAVVSELRKGPERADPGVVRWNDGVVATSTYLSVVTIRELRTGAELVARRDGRAGEHLHTWVDHVVELTGSRLLPIDLDIAEECAALHVPDPLPSEDAWIAATAVVHGLTVVTRNTRDFTRSGVDVVNPWSA